MIFFSLFTIWSRQIVIDRYIIDSIEIDIKWFAVACTSDCMSVQIFSLLD